MVLGTTLPSDVRAAFLRASTLVARVAARTAILNIDFMMTNDESSIKLEERLESDERPTKRKTLKQQMDLDFVLSQAISRRRGYWALPYFLKQLVIAARERASWNGPQALRLHCRSRS